MISSIEPVVGHKTIVFLNICYGISLNGVLTTPRARGANASRETREGRAERVDPRRARLVLACVPHERTVLVCFGSVLEEGRFPQVSIRFGLRRLPTRLSLWRVPKALQRSCTRPRDQSPLKTQRTYSLVGRRCLAAEFLARSHLRCAFRFKTLEYHHEGRFQFLSRDCAEFETTLVLGFPDNTLDRLGPNHQSHPLAKTQK